MPVTTSSALKPVIAAVMLLSVALSFYGCDDDSDNPISPTSATFAWSKISGTPTTAWVSDICRITPDYLVATNYSGVSCSR